MSLRRREKPFLLPFSLLFSYKCSGWLRRIRVVARRQCKESNLRKVWPPKHYARLICAFYCEPIFCTYTALSAIIIKWLPFFFTRRLSSQTAITGCVMLLLCVSVFVSQLNGFFNLCQEWVSSPPLATQNTTAAIPLSTLGPPQYVRVCVFVCVPTHYFSDSFLWN